MSLVSISAVRGRGSLSDQVDLYLQPNMDRRGPLAAPDVVFVQEVPARAKSLYQAAVDDLAQKEESEGFDKLKSAIEVFPTYSRT